MSPVSLSLFDTLLQRFLSVTEEHVVVTSILWKTGQNLFTKVSSHMLSCTHFQGFVATTELSFVAIYCDEKEWSYNKRDCNVVALCLLQALFLMHSSIYVLFKPISLLSNWKSAVFPRSYWSIAIARK